MKFTRSLWTSMWISCAFIVYAFAEDHQCELPSPGHATENMNADIFKITEKFSDPQE